MKTLLRSLSALLLLVTLSFGVPAVASAACDNNSNPLACTCSAGANESDACKTDPNTDPIGGSKGVLKKVSLVIAFIAGVAAVIVILVASLMYVTAGGDSQKTASARNAIIGAAIGLIIIAASESILILVINKV